MKLKFDSLVYHRLKPRLKYLPYAVIAESIRGVCKKSLWFLNFK